MRKEIADLIDRIDELPPDWHGAGTMGKASLTTIARHVETLGPLLRSAETGSGKSSLLLSHLSADHRVFAVDVGASMSQVRQSPLLRRENVTFVEGPTQVTLPQYRFPQPLQFALIDGPHGYPFPDLEYYYFYPVLAPGGLLLVDDLPIPSIGRMFDIIRADDMFELVEVMDDQLGVLRRTHAPLVDPQSDSWWLQGYNRAHYERIQQPRKAPSPTALQIALRSTAAIVPQGVKDRLPEKVKNKLISMM